MSSLINADQSLLIWGLLFSIVAVGFWSETTNIGRRLSGVIVVLALSMLLSNIRILPTNSGVYDTAWSAVVPIAIPLLLAKANLRSIFSQTGRMLITFFCAALATVIGVFVAFFLVDLGDASADLAGVFAATYIGGSVNFAAVVEALQLKDASLLSATAAADNVVGSIYLLIIALVPASALFQKYFSPKVQTQVENVNNEPEPKIYFNPTHLAIALAFGCIVSFSGKALAQWLGFNSYSLIITTVLAFAIANLFPKQMEKLQGEDVLGMFLMYLFFAAVGAGANIGSIFNFGFSIFVFAAVVVTTHFIVITLFAYFLKIDIYEALITSNACIMGPATAAAQAVSEGRSRLVTPAIICGSLGYAFANFIALALVKGLS